MRHFPLFLDLQGRDVAVVGGGEVALRKVQALLSAGAVVTVVAPELHDALAAQLAQRTPQAVSRRHCTRAPPPVLARCITFLLRCPPIQRPFWRPIGSRKLGWWWLLRIMRP